MPRLSPRFCLRLSLALVSGATLTLAYPRWNWEPAVWIGLVPLLALLWPADLDRPSPRRPFAWGWLAGLAFFLPNLAWVRHSSRVIHGAQGSEWMGWSVEGLGWLAVSALSCYLALYWGLWAWFTARIARPRATALISGSAFESTLESLRASLLCAAAWVACEWLRGWVLTGFGWNGLGVALHRNTVLMQNAALVGVTGLSFLPPLLAATGWINALRLLRHWRGQPVTRTRLDFTLSVVLLLSAAVYGLWQIRTFHPAERPVVRTLLIQPNVSQFVKWGREDILALYRQLDQRTRLYTEAAGPTTDGFDLIVWPENAVPVNLDDSPEADAFHRSFFEPLLQTGNFSLLTGAQTRTPDGGGQNSAVLFSPQTYTPRQSASKQHLVPFGEYLPLRQQLPILERLLGHILPGDFVPGQGTQPLTLTASGESVGIVPLICFEDTVGRLARRFVRPGPQILANITNDGWFLHSDETEVHLANARFRAVELRRPLLRAANTGVTCFIDPLGRTLSQLDDPATGSTFIEGCLPGALRFAPGSALTFYARFGDIFSYLCLALTSSALLLHLSRRKKTHASTVEPTASHPTDHR